MQDVYGSDEVSFELGEQRYFFDFDWNDLLSYIFYNGVDDAVSHYLQKIVDGITSSVAAV